MHLVKAPNMPPAPKPPHAAPPSGPSPAPIWAIVGPTACGKSALALQLASRMGAEIISADAMQVYRGCTIGTAKPTAEERRRVPHHLVDVADPSEPFDAQQFVDAATSAIADVRARGRVPLLCGGTGLYLRALRLGLVEVPKDPALRARLEAADAQDGGTSLRLLHELDPQSARTIDPNNGAYVRRAVEISLVCGRPASAVRAEHSQRAEQTPMVLWWLDRSDEALRARIEARIQAMVAQGFENEVRALLAQGQDPQSTALRSLGYREMVAMLEGSVRPENVGAAIAKSTWNYVRRQRIWLRREERQAKALVRRLWLPGATAEVQPSGDGEAMALGRIADELMAQWQAPGPP